MASYARFLSMILLGICTNVIYGQTLSNINKLNKGDSLLEKSHGQKLNASETSELKEYAISVQNQGQLLDESCHNYSASLQNINRAIQCFIVLKDTLDLANNRKFKGYLLSKMGMYTDAKTEINSALYLYSLKNKGWGIAVSQFDLSKVYDAEAKPDSALFYTNMALSFWQTAEDNYRIFIINTMKLNLLTKMKRFEGARAIENESKNLIAHNQFHWQGLLDFYFISARLYAALGQSPVFASYQNLYLTEIDTLKTKGISAKSTYDNVR